ncbi:MAG: type II secretion system protein [Phycisphaerae bacterium]
MVRRTQPGPAGFTLVELLIVISIIALLISILLPSLGRAKESARVISCRSNLRAIGVAFRMYLDDSRDLMPCAAQLPSAKLNHWPRIVDILLPYAENPELFRCPADTKKNYFLSEGSSYEYHTLVGGRKTSEWFLARRLGESKAPVMHDYEPFHGLPGQPGATNFLFADGSVGDLVD